MPQVRTRTHRTPALLVTLSIAGAAALAVPSGALAAQGDDEAMIAVIEQAMPAVVTIQVPGASFGGVTQDEDGSDEQGQPGDAEDAGDSEGSEDARDAEDSQGAEDEQDPGDAGQAPDLQDVLPEGFQLPEGFELPEGFDFQNPDQFRLPGGTGSGVLIDPSGVIITNGHVVGSADEVEVILEDGTVMDGSVTAVDTLTDFAFVKVDGQDLPTLPLGDSSSLRIGQRAVAIGNPLGQFPGSVSIGIVSGLDRTMDVFTGGPTGGERLRHLIQTDAAVNPGNSGGAVIDGDGKLIGITTAQAGMADGIGFALPIDLAKPIIDQAIAGEDLARPYIGVLYQDIDAQLATDESLPVKTGAWVRSFDESQAAVVDGGPADEAGVEAGDIITAVDGTPVDASNPLDLQVLRFGPGEEVTLSVLRDGETLTLPVTLGTRPADLAA
jgi:S1-C subfamily serine protease